MRRKILSLVALLAALCGVSCSTDMATGVDALPGAELGFYVDLSDATRVSYEGGKYGWEGDERLGVYVASAQPTPNTYADVELKDGRGYCTATTTAWTAGDKMYVYHPFSDVNDAYGVKDVRLFLPARQSVKVNSLDASLVPMVGEPLTLSTQATPSVYMRPLASILCFRVYAAGAYAGEKLTSVCYADEDTPMTGEFTLDATTVGSETWGLEGGDTNYAMATLATPYTVGSSKEAASVVYLLVAPNNYSGTLTVTTDKAVYTYNYSKTVARNTYYDVNVNLSEATARKSIVGTFGGGDGSAANPYIIATASDLATLSTSCAAEGESYRNKNIKQVADIDLSKVTFSPIGSETLPFEGVYDGGNFSVSGIVIPAENTAPCGLFGCVSGATVKNVVINGIENNGAGGKVGGVAGSATNSTFENCVMNSDLYASVTVSGGIVGYMSGGKVSGCTTTSTIKSITEEWAQSGGMVGLAENGALVENCTLSGNMASMSKRVGGMVGELKNSTVKGCRVTSNAEVFNNAHSCGGIVGGHYGGTVSDCVVEGTIGSQGDYCGGISGYFNSGEIRNCVTQGSATVITYNDYSGGIAGSAFTTGTCIIDCCASYADVRACHSVGGIVGYIKSNDGGKVIISNSMHADGDLFSTGLNSSSYSLVGGVCGWTHGAGTSSVVYVNLCARPKVMRGLSFWISQTSRVAMGGVTGFRNGVKTVTLSNVYTDVTNGTILIDDAPVQSSLLHFGALLGPVTAINTTSAYYIEGEQPVGASHTSYVKGEGCPSLTATQMSDGTMLKKLNDYVAANPTVEDITLKSWVAGPDGYPVISGLPLNNEPVIATPKRVSIIGDSISTFRGYISYNYSAHYPTTDGDLNLVGQTYWYRLIYDHMQNARLERNLAYSGTAVARTTNTSYSEKTWYGQDFCTRFINQQGLGKADIVLIHGGTNDYGHNVDELAPGVAMRSTSAPSDSVLKPLFDAADNAKTRAEIEALDDTNFCSAYIKLVCLIKERNPQVKVVCIIGDVVSVGIQKSIQKIAEHYGAKVVDLYAVNGFNDQVYMPKHDYDPSTGSGCHPSSKAMEFIADKIYTELGSWLEN